MVLISLKKRKVTNFETILKCDFHLITKYKFFSNLGHESAYGTKKDLILEATFFQGYSSFHLHIKLHMKKISVNRKTHRLKLKSTLSFSYYSAEKISGVSCG